MKQLILYSLIAFMVGDCVQLVKGVFKGEYWVIARDHHNGTFNLRQGQYYLTNVRGSFLQPTDAKSCKQPTKNK